MEKDIKKESEKLFAKIKAHTPKLVELSCNCCYILGRY